MFQLATEIAVSRCAFDPRNAPNSGKSARYAPQRVRTADWLAVCAVRIELCSRPEYPDKQGIYREFSRGTAQLQPVRRTTPLNLQRFFPNSLFKRTGNFLILAGNTRPRAANAASAHLAEGTILVSNILLMESRRSTPYFAIEHHAVIVVTLTLAERHGGHGFSARLRRARSGEKIADRSADRLLPSHQQMSASVVDDQFSIRDLAHGELSCWQRVKPVIPRRDYQRRRGDFLQRQFMQARGTIYIDSRESQRQRLNAFNNAHHAISLDSRRSRDEFRPNSEKTNQHRRSNLLGGPPSEISASVDDPKYKPITSTGSDRNWIGWRVSTWDDQDKAFDPIRMPDRQLYGGTCTCRDANHDRVRNLEFGEQCRVCIGLSGRGGVSRYWGPQIPETGWRDDPKTVANKFGRVSQTLVEAAASTMDRQERVSRTGFGVFDQACFGIREHTASADRLACTVKLSLVKQETQGDCSRYSNRRRQNGKSDSAHCKGPSS